LRSTIPTRDLSKRTVIIGNSGSGKSTLAQHISDRLGVPVVDLDALHWETGGYGRKRDEKIAISLATDAAAKPRWIIEGVYGWLAAAVVRRATALIWLDLPWRECRSGLLARGVRRGADERAFAELLAWGEGYRSRSTSSSFEGHQRIFESFKPSKIRLRSRDEVSDFTNFAPPRNETRLEWAAFRRGAREAALGGEGCRQGHTADRDQLRR
jgi:adenylate kinase family enzyme